MGSAGFHAEDMDYSMHGRSFVLARYFIDANTDPSGCQIRQGTDPVEVDRGASPS